MQKLKLFLGMAAVLLLVVLTAFKCGSENEPKPVINKGCNVDNPLIELEWLKTMVDAYANESYLEHAEVSKCKYADSQDGFLINGCVGCPDFATELYSCDGTLLCLMYGEDGINHCDEYQIDESSIELIFNNRNQ